MTALYAIPIGFVKYKFAFFSEKICLNLAESDMRMLYWKQMQEKQHPKGGMRVAQADDERQFLAACYQRHRISMIRLAKCYAADSAAVEDIVSDSLVALMEKIDLLRTLTEEQERAYVLAVVRNTAMDELRRKQRQRGRFLQQVLRLKVLENRTDAEIAAETGLSPGSIRQYLHRARGRLREKLF